MKKTDETIVTIGGIAFLLTAFVIFCTLVTGAAAEFVNGGQSHFPGWVASILRYVVPFWVATLLMFIIAVLWEPARVPCKS